MIVPNAAKADIIAALEKARFKGSQLLLLGAEEEADDDSDKETAKMKQRKKTMKQAAPAQPKRARALVEVSDSDSSSDDDVPLAALVQHKKPRVVLVLSDDSE